MERAVILSETAFFVDESWLKLESTQSRQPREGLSTLSDREVEIIEAALADCNGRIDGPSGAAAKLGIPRELDIWMRVLPRPWTVAMEATIFTGWIYDHLHPHATQVKVAHPLVLRAIAAAKKKNDRVDASQIADCLRCDFLPECHMASTEIRDRRRTLRYRCLLVRQMIQTKNRISGLFMETWG